MSASTPLARPMSADQNSAFRRLLASWRRLEDARLAREAYPGLVDARFALEDARTAMRRSLASSN